MPQSSQSKAWSIGGLSFTKFILQLLADLPHRFDYTPYGAPSSAFPGSPVYIFAENK
jgi:hypothetical protein